MGSLSDTLAVGATAASAGHRHDHRQGRPIHGAAPNRSARAAVADDLSTSLATLSILIVEDEPVFRAIFARRLGLDALRVEAVADAASALAALEGDHWDLLCIDNGLPDRSGRELAAEIRRCWPNCGVILVTASATRPDDPNLMGPGVDAILPKPCTDVELARAVRAARSRPAARSRLR